MTTILILISVIYLILIWYFILGWNKIPSFNLQNLTSKIEFSVIIPFRNEGENLPSLLYSLSALKYPSSLFEILLINDESEDHSVEICMDFKMNNPELQVQIIANKRTSASPKKDAIATGIEVSKFEHIITTDADCEVPLYWLQIFNEILIESQSKLVAGPVGFQELNSKSLLANFEELDFMSLQAAGAGAFGINKAFMCNGANLCYNKAAFFEAEGFEGNDHVSSGDDVFLLQKFQEKNFPVAYLKSHEADVLTTHHPNISSLISQRIRWAAKSSAYKSNFAKLTGIVVLLMNFCLAIGILLAFAGLISYKAVLICFLIKFYMDLVLISKWSNYFKKNNILKHFWWCSIIYPFFTSYVAIMSLFTGFEWKGRSFRK